MNLTGFSICHRPTVITYSDLYSSASSLSDRMFSVSQNAKTPCRGVLVTGSQRREDKNKKYDS